MIYCCGEYSIIIGLCNINFCINLHHNFDLCNLYKSVMLTDENLFAPHGSLVMSRHCLFNFRQSFFIRFPDFSIVFIFVLVLIYSSYNIEI